ncbi:MAG: hypothetical protein ACOZCL_11065 [Bacillota bacterium]
MLFDYAGFITNPFVLIFTAIAAGAIIGKIRLGRFELGASGGLFTGLVLGWFVYSKYALPYINAEDTPVFAANILKEGMVPKSIFDFALILFVASVGLLASRDIGRIIKKYGIKFIVLGVIITLTGALGIYSSYHIFNGLDSHTAAGVYTGALTSSPGLAAAIETAAELGGAAEAQIGYGYAVAYAPGVIVVILAMQLLPFLFRIDIEKEKKNYIIEMKTGKDAEPAYNNKSGIDIIGFSIVCVMGYILGSLNFYLGTFIGSIKLGSTGGVLIVSLLLGYIGRIGFIDFRIEPRVLGAIKDMAIAVFLAVVGLRYGYEAVSSLSGNGAVLALVSFMDGLFAIMVGFAVGRYVFKMNWILLAGAICGGMTSTPGLGAAIDSTGSDEVASGYGATYPFALIGMVIFSIILNRILQLGLF